jgi:hypothetical protein
MKWIFFPHQLTSIETTGTYPGKSSQMAQDLRLTAGRASQLEARADHESQTVPKFHGNHKMLHLLQGSLCLMDASP